MTKGNFISCNSEREKCQNIEIKSYSTAEIKVPSNW